MLLSINFGGSFSSVSFISMSSSTVLSRFQILSKVIVCFCCFSFRTFVIVVVDRHFYVGAHVEFLLGKFSMVAYAKFTCAFTSNKNSVKLACLSAGDHGGRSDFLTLFSAFSMAVVMSASILFTIILRVGVSHSVDVACSILCLMSYLSQYRCSSLRNLSTCVALLELIPRQSGEVIFSCFPTNCFVLKSITIPLWLEDVLNMNGSYIDAWMDGSSEVEHNA